MHVVKIGCALRNGSKFNEHATTHRFSIGSYTCTTSRTPNSSNARREMAP